jgi:molybdopterin converting factor subunit 1
MTVRVRLFATLRERLGATALELELPSGACVADAWQRLVAREPELAPLRGRLGAAVNRSYAPFEAPLADGDEIAFIPPVAGG